MTEKVLRQKQNGMKMMFLLIGGLLLTCALFAFGISMVAKWNAAVMEVILGGVLIVVGILGFIFVCVCF